MKKTLLFTLALIAVGSVELEAQQTIDLSELITEGLELAPRGGRFWTRDSSSGGVLLLVVERGHLAEG